MRDVKVASAALGLILGVLAAVPASAWDRRITDMNSFSNLATLPGLVDANGMLLVDMNGNANTFGSAEGLTVGPDNRIYAASTGSGTIANLFVMDASGNFYIGLTNMGTCARPQTRQCSVRIQGSTPNVLGIRFNPTNSASLLVLDRGNCDPALPHEPPCKGTMEQPQTPPQILNINPATGDGVRLAIDFQNDAFLNGLAFDGAGNMYASDSWNGRIYVMPVGNPGGTYIWSSDPALLPSNPRTVAPCPPMDPNKPRCPNPNGILPAVGANGIEFTRDPTSPMNRNPCTPGVTTGCALLVANTANRQILQLTCCRFDANNRSIANPATVFVSGINGPDGIAIDPATNNIWVAANQSDEIVVIQQSTAGPPVVGPRVIAKLGDFNGISPQTRVRELLFPSSLALSNLNPPAMFPPPPQRMLYVA